MASIKGFIDWVKGEDVEEEEYEREPPRTRTNEPTVGNSSSSGYERDYISSVDSGMSRESVTSREPGLPRRSSTNTNNVVNINSAINSQLSVVLVKPEKFESVADIADHLKEQRTVVLNLEQTNKDIARRIVDFLSGVAYAKEGKIKKIANSTYLITPVNVELLGELIDELENNGVYF